jgi:hypothetical protein
LGSKIRLRMPAVWHTASTTKTSPNALQAQLGAARGSKLRHLLSFVPQALLTPEPTACCSKLQRLTRQPWHQPTWPAVALYFVLMENRLSMGLGSAALAEISRPMPATLRHSTGSTAQHSTRSQPLFRGKGSKVPQMPVQKEGTKFTAIRSRQHHRHVSNMHDAGPAENFSCTGTCCYPVMTRARPGMT